MSTENKHTQARSRHAIRGRLLAIGAVAVMACDSQTTAPDAAPGSGEELIEFELTSEGADLAQTASMVGLHKLPTVALRNRAETQFSASVGQMDNSPFDLTYFGGRVVKTARSYNVYISCPEGPAACWGTGTLTPHQFLRDLNNSDYINVVSEYIGRQARGMFPAQGMRTSVSFTNNRATLQEIFHILADAVRRTSAAGYQTIYHVFLRQGTEMCISEGNCYSPSEPQSWTFCAFHGSMNLSNGRHVLFTVEPYQAVSGCQLPGQTPNGVIDATASTLAHELFETITDPDLDGWSNGLFGYEISDMCSFFGRNQVLNGNRYFIQSEYSNKLHSCTDRAPTI